MRGLGWLRLAILLGVWAARTATGATGSVDYTYDDAGRLRTGTFSDGTVVDYQYDPAGNRTVMTMGVPGQLSIAPPTSNATEGNALLFRVTRTGTTLQDVTVTCAPTDGTAVAGGSDPYNDYTTTPQTVTFLTTDASPITKNCSITTRNDSYYEGLQTVNATLQNATGGAVITTASAVGTIADSDPAPTFSVTGEAEPEGTSITFTVTKSTTNPTEHTHAVDYGTANGSATTSDNDYEAKSGTLSYSPSQSSKTVAVTNNQDSKYENNETFTLSLSNPTQGSGIGTGSATGTINNNDSAPTFAINDPAAVNEGVSATFTITKSGSTGLSHSLTWSTANGTAQAPDDYTAVSGGTVTFNAGDATKTVSVTTKTDNEQDGAANETFFVNLTTNANSNGAVIADAQGKGTIADMQGIPGIPGNLLTSPLVQVGVPGTYSVLWDTATGPVDHYKLEETANFGTPVIYTIDAPTTVKAFPNSGSGEYRYKVKACNNINVCSDWSNSRKIIVCNPTCN